MNLQNVWRHGFGIPSKSWHWFLHLPSKTFKPFLNQLSPTSREKKIKKLWNFLLLKNILVIYLVPLPLKFTLEGLSGMSGFLMCFVLNPVIDILYTLMVIPNSHTKQPNMSLSDKIEMKVVYVLLSTAIFCSLYFINSFQYFVML